MKMTDNEIIKALGCCQVGKDKCKKCPLYCVVPACSRYLAESALDIINRQKAEIERLNNKCDSILFCHSQEITEAKAWAKAESIIEFAEKLKEIGKQEGAYDYVSLWDIDKLLKDMTGED